MLPTQVTYWANQEQKRHNLRTEELTRQQQTIDARNAASNEKNAESNARKVEVDRQNMEINSINALTNQEQARIGAVNAETQKGQLNVAQEQLKVSQLDAQTRARQAGAAETQAAAAIAQAAYQGQKVQSEVARNLAQTELTQLESKFYTPAKVVDVASKGVGTLNMLKSGITKILTRK